MLNKSWMPAVLWFFDALCAGMAAEPGVRYDVRVWGPKEGLSAVLTMTQTRDGYLWLGTPNGLVRFDGFRFTTFDENNTPGLDNNYISKVFEDSRSNLWIGTQSGGIKLVKDGRVIAVQPDPGFHAGQLESVCEDASGAVWLYTDDGTIIRYHDGKGAISGGARRLPSNRRFIIADKAGAVWMGVDQELFTTGGAALTGADVFPTNRIDSVGRVDYLLASRRGGFWCLADGHVQKWATNRMERDFGPYPWNPLLRIADACEDREGNLVVGTAGAGVYWFDADGIPTQISTAQGLSLNNVRSVVVDQADNLWVGTDGLGLNRVKRCRFGVLNEREQRTVQSVCEDQQGGLWIGCNGGTGAVQYWKSGVFQTQFGTNQDLLVKSVLVARDGRVLAGTWGPWDQWQLPKGGLFAVSSNGVQAMYNIRQTTNPAVVEFQSPQSVSAIYQNRKGLLWAGTKIGLICLNGTNWKTWTTNDGLSSADVRAMVEDAEGTMWIGTDGGGLGCLREGRITVFNKQDGLPSEHISSLLLDGDGTLWVGTSGGLARRRNGKWTRYTTDDGLISNSIGYLLEDGEGWLWIGSNLGLMRVEKRALNQFAENPTNTFSCRVFGEEDGLPSLVCTSGSQPAACRTGDGTLWFPTIKGVASIDPAKIKRNLIPPPVVIETVSVQGQPHKTADLRTQVPERLTVPAGNEVLDIQYTSLNLAEADKTRFRYRMQPDQTGWVQAGDRRIAPYGKLSPGEYQFQVTACNEDGVWNETPATLAVTVLPPFWRQGWFIGVNALVLLGIIIGVVHYISTQKLQRQLAGLRQQQALEKERARIARDIHDQLGASLTQVSLLGELVESDKESPGEVEAHAKQISKTARDTARVLDEIVWTVNPSNDTLDGLVNYVCKYAQEYLAVAGLRYRLDVPAELPEAVISPEVRHNVFLAAKEAVTNVVRHARATSVFIRLRLEPAAFTLEIQDDGRATVNWEAQKASSRNGLRNMSKRMEDIGGSFAISTVPEGGTLVRLTVPIKKT